MHLTLLISVSGSRIQRPLRRSHKPPRPKLHRVLAKDLGHEVDACRCYLRQPALFQQIRLARAMVRQERVFAHIAVNIHNPDNPQRLPHGAEEERTLRPQLRGVDDAIVSIDPHALVYLLSLIHI